MRKRRLPADYHALGRLRGFRWLGPPVSRTSMPTNWRCRKKFPDGTPHEWPASYSNISSRGSGCPHCSRKSRLTEPRFRELADAKGLEWLGARAVQSRQNTKWRCWAAGHIFTSSYNKIDQAKGNGCRFCSGHRPITKSMMEQVGAMVGLRWTGKGKIGSHEKTTWRCDKFQHLYRATYSSVRLGKRCSHCVGNAKKTAEEFKTAGDRRGFDWIGAAVVNARTNTGWRCRVCEYEWRAPYSNINNGTSGCKRCSRREPKSADDYHALVATRDISWVGTEVVGTHTKTLWRCRRDRSHPDWETTYRHISRGQGCPACDDRVNGFIVSRQQRSIREMLGGQLNEKVGRYSVDVAITFRGRRVAIEYDSWYSHGANTAAEVRKDECLLAEHWAMVRIRSNALVPTLAQMQSAISAAVATGKAELVLDDWGKGDVRRGAPRK